MPMLRMLTITSTLDIVKSLSVSPYRLSVEQREQEHHVSTGKFE